MGHAGDSGVNLGWCSLWVHRWLVSEAALDLQNHVPVLEEGIDTARVEVLALAVAQQLNGLLDPPGLLLRALRGQGIKDIRHRNDAAEKRNGLARQAARIAAAVELLVVGECDLGRHLQQG